MDERVPVRLGAIQETLLLPLWGRAVESARRRPRLDDPVARRIVSQIDFDFERLARTMSEISRLAWIARSLVFDSFIRSFLATNEPATIVNIGCGFDTTFAAFPRGLRLRGRIGMAISDRLRIMSNVHLRMGG